MPWNECKNIKSIDRRASGRRALAFLLGLAVGCVCFLWIYGTPSLDVTDCGWIVNRYDEWDVQQHYAGWLFFRDADWSFPLGYADNLGLPNGTMITYTDSLPWVSVILKLFRSFQPRRFQWFGWYVLICFVLQGAAGAWLAGRRHFDGGKSGAWLAYSLSGAVLFCLLPSLWERAFRHTALASHYIYLFALYFYLEYRSRLRQGSAPVPISFALLAFWAVGIHPYFLPLVMIPALAAAVDCARFASARRGAAQFALALGAALGGAWMVGAVGTGASLSRDGYGYYALNLNALINPCSVGEYTWSRVLPVLPQDKGQYDGFNYLGLGILLLLAIALAAALAGTIRSPRRARKWWNRNLALAAGCAFLTLFAVTNNISINETIYEIPLPEALTDLCGIFRASSRMFYLVAACMLVFALYTVQDTFRALPGGVALSAVFLCIVCGVQIWDLSLAAAEKREKFLQETQMTVVDDPVTQGLGQGHDKLLCTQELPNTERRHTAILAGHEGLATDIVIDLSGDNEASFENYEQTAADLRAGRYDRDTVYVTIDEEMAAVWQENFGNDPTVKVIYSYPCYFLVPDPA